MPTITVTEREVGQKAGWTDERRAKASQPRCTWARAHDACVECGTVETPHKDHGRCEKCHEAARTERAWTPRPLAVRVNLVGA